MSQLPQHNIDQGKALKISQVYAASNSVLNVRIHKSNASQKHHSTQPESKGKSSHRLHFSHQNSRPEFPDWALGAHSAAHQHGEISHCGWLETGDSSLAWEPVFTVTSHEWTGYKYRLISPRWRQSSSYVSLQTQILIRVSFYGERGDVALLSATRGSSSQPNVERCCRRSASELSGAGQGLA